MESILNGEKGTYEPKYPYLMKHFYSDRVILRTDYDTGIYVFSNNKEMFPLGGNCSPGNFNMYLPMPEGSSVTLTQKF